jgi:hypothetical protein
LRLLKAQQAHSHPVKAALGKNDVGLNFQDFLGPECCPRIAACPILYQQVYSATDFDVLE